MKKIILLLLTFSVMQMIAKAQVDLSLFTRDQIWLFEKERSGGFTADGIIITKEGHLYEYEDANYPEYKVVESIPDYRQHKAVFNESSTYIGSVTINKENKTLTFTRNGYHWKIEKLTNDAFVLKRGKLFDNGFNLPCPPNTLKFKRHKTYTSGCLPVLWLCGGSMDSDIIEAGGCNYHNVLPFNTFACLDPYAVSDETIKKLLLAPEKKK
jgi:hypothetical protein